MIRRMEECRLGVRASPHADYENVLERVGLDGLFL